MRTDMATSEQPKSEETKQKEIEEFREIEWLIANLRTMIENGKFEGRHTYADMLGRIAFYLEREQKYLDWVVNGH